MYYIKITSSYDPKNNLQKYLSVQLNRLEGLTIENPDELKQHLERLVFRANMCYKRCTPTSVYLRADKGNFSAGVSGLMQISLYQQRGVFNSSELLRPGAVTAKNQQTALF